MNFPRDPFSGQHRQIHLDFHNSPWLDDLLADFDPTALARRFIKASVNSVIVFAKCVHGMGYYPSKIVQPHPALKGRDFTGEMIEALHREGIRAPIYTIIGWEENLAQLHPDWIQLCSDGTFAQNAASSDGVTPQPGRFRWLNFLHPELQDYFEAHLDELLDRYPIDGLFLDMLVVHPKADWSDHALRFREKKGLLANDTRTHALFEAQAQASFAQKFTRQILGKAPRASIFYNAENRLFTDGSLGALARLESQTHAEIESLPAGMWNYSHFPRVARNLRHRTPWLGMTGRFQKMWGDFGGIKPPPALEFECFRSQAMGGANSVGDQLHPRGTLDEGAYALIGGVFAQCAAAEPFYAQSENCTRIALVCPHDPALNETLTTQVEEGMVNLCQRLHYDCELINDTDSLDPYDLVILGEETLLSPSFSARINDFVQAGGKLLFSGNALTELTKSVSSIAASLTVAKPNNFTTAYNRARSQTPAEAALGQDDRVVYHPGKPIIGWDPSITVWTERVYPYFQRTDLRFCSHFQAPARPESSGEATVLSTPNWVYFADPIFTEYRLTGNVAAFRLFAEAMKHLVGESEYGAGLKSTVRLYPRRVGNSLRLTLLHYIMQRITPDTDIISERQSFAGQILRLPSGVKKVVDWTSGEPLAIDPSSDGFILPPREGRLLLEIPDYFSAP